MPWPRQARLSEAQLKQENDGLRTTILCLRREIESKQGHVQRLEVLLCSRLQTIDELHAKVDSLREQIKRLTAVQAQAQSQA